MRASSIQHYPRKDDLFDESSVKPHNRTLTEADLRRIVEAAIQYANRKSSREMLDIPQGISDAEAAALYKASGAKLFDYFKRYSSDPASTAHQCNGRHYADVAREQFRNRALQKERMNAGWRYQFIAEGAAQETHRFRSISGIGAQEADFNAVIDYTDRPGTLTIYVSVKNRVNTMGGQDWPKAIAAMESVAVPDEYEREDNLYVIGIIMERGTRTIKKHSKTKAAHSNNTEIWKSDFFWPFFTNCSYEEIVRAILSVLIATQEPENLDVPVPEELITSFRDCCRKAGLLDEEDRFNDPYKLASFLC